MRIPPPMTRKTAPVDGGICDCDKAMEMRGKGPCWECRRWRRRQKMMAYERTQQRLLAQHPYKVRTDTPTKKRGVPTQKRGCVSQADRKTWKAVHDQGRSHAIDTIEKGQAHAIETIDLTGESDEPRSLSRNKT